MKLIFLAIIIYSYITSLDYEQLKAVVDSCGYFEPYEKIKTKMDSIVGFPKYRLIIADYSYLYTLFNKEGEIYKCKNINYVNFYFFEKLFNYDADNFNYDKLANTSENNFNKEDYKYYIYLAIDNIHNIKDNKYNEYSNLISSFVKKSSKISADDKKKIFHEIKKELFISNLLTKTISSEYFTNYKPLILKESNTTVDTSNSSNNSKQSINNPSVKDVNTNGSNKPKYATATSNNSNKESQPNKTNNVLMYGSNYDKHKYAVAKDINTANITNNGKSNASSSNNKKRIFNDKNKTNSPQKSNETITTSNKDSKAKSAETTVAKPNSITNNVKQSINASFELLTISPYKDQISKIKSKGIFDNLNKLILGNKYVILKEKIKIKDKNDNILGEGSFGKVYKYKANNDEEVAAKCFETRKLSSSKTYKDLFNEEINNNYELQEKYPESVMNIYGIALFENNNDFKSYEICLVYEILDMSLSELIKNNTTEYNKKDITLQLLDALKNMHSLNILHLDIKPDNIMLKIEYIGNKKVIKVKFIDFGFSKKVKNVKEFEDLKNSFGSPIYMNLMAFINYYSEYSDMYSLYLTIYELIIGKIFFSYIRTENQLIRELQTEIPNIDDSFILKDILNDCFKYQYNGIARCYDNRYISYKLKANIILLKPTYYSLDTVISKVKALPEYKFK